MKIGHVHLKVRNLDGAIAFYQRYFDMKVTEQVGSAFAFLSAGGMHHELALQEVGSQAGTPKRHDVGLYHVAFEVPDKDSLVETFKKLQKDGVAVHPVDHRISWALYFSDPDGNGMEVYWDTRGTEHGVETWEGVDRPLTENQLS
ncbi:MAG TPA: VOC family protein [Desulfuromonadales bacterium]|nr:VOC family protein [Desulfuromonadales bacterium]